MTDLIAGKKVVELGNGRFANVECWRMVDRSLVAIKMFSSDNFRTRDKELKALTIVGTDSHYMAQIAAAHEEVHATMCCIVMGAYLGGSLNKHIQQCGKGGFHITVIRSYIAELLSALAHLERVECIHRDIKSTNCVLDHIGRLKLCDFGSATILDNSYSRTPRSRPPTAGSKELPSSRAPLATDANIEGKRTYTITGTAVIMAPEMAATSIGYDYSVDYWAVGVLLYELLTCRLPAFDRTPSLPNNLTVSSVPLVWPTVMDSEIARAATLLDATTDPANPTATVCDTCVSLTSASKPLSRPNTASKKEVDKAEDNLNENKEEMHQALQRCWFLESVDPAFGAAKASTTNKNADLNAILGNFSFTPKKCKDDVLSEQAVDLVRCLLTVNPIRRYSRLVASHNSKHSNTTPATENFSWNHVVRMHPFFEEVDWFAVDNGLSPPANADFDRRLGCMELLEEFDTGDDELTTAQQALFDGF